MGSKKRRRQRIRQKNREKRDNNWWRGRTALILTAIALIVTVSILGAVYAGGGNDAGGEADIGGGIDTGGGTGVGGGTGDNNGAPKLISPEWIGAGVLGIGSDTVSIPTSEIASGKMLHFAVSSLPGGAANFMAYNLAGQTHVRANVCPPCRSIGFSLLGDILVCDSCGTRFNANTGDGISGACKDFPKAAVEYAVSGDNMVMGFDDLTISYANTEKPGWP
jgi:nitrite reductase/ring-hydroxylating ferredoxin subunit